jgi:hypothetical protein
MHYPTKDASILTFFILLSVLLALRAGKAANDERRLSFNHQDSIVSIVGMAGPVGSADLLSLALWPETVLISMLSGSGGSGFD